MTHHPSPAALRPAPDPLAAREAQLRARLRALHGCRIASAHITLHLRPEATPDERRAVAELLLAGTGHRIAPDGAA